MLAYRCVNENCKYFGQQLGWTADENKFCRCGDAYETFQVLDDGGTAFPNADVCAGPDLRTPGMSLRHYFAAKAMLGMFSGTANPNSSGIGRRNFRNTAEAAYWMADAMIEAGKVVPPTSKLIDAAPTLLEALQRIVCADLDGMISREDWSFARAAIAKATGGQS